ncbi:HD domain-containing protein [Rubellicoccus peritrichatus]|uniref:HD domain-containing protein n=1 Tax=Rubellicoccus peritrichatus TaxID=3080537 RepID=A0AAQ3LA48_9BACT|nr:HD domain-containing protein [Puniceicoccus sp. CR14]WOO41636.1 HD domain-containing protein [Puniceicoccus sp. CR14]
MLNESLDFLIECEKLKQVERMTSPVGAARRENSAEHSWSLCLAAMTLIPVVEPELDTLRVIEMLLIHDIVEIDAGDTFCYADQTGKIEKENLAADRIFGLLPHDAAQKFHQRWDEFERRETAESRFANALDRIFPLLQNYHNKGGTWIEHGITFEQVFQRNREIANGSEALWDYARRIIEASSENGWLPKSNP